MNKVARKILWLVIPLALLLAAAASPLLLPYLLFWPEVVKDIGLSFFEKSRTVREGEAYGFRIGETKEETFAAARTLIAEGEFGQLSPWADRETYRLVYPGFFDYQSPRRVAGDFAGWDSWKIRGCEDGETEEVQLFFYGSGNTLRQIDWARRNVSGRPTKYPDEWPPPVGLPKVKKGMSPGEAHEALVRLSGCPGYEGIEMAPAHLAWRVIDDFTAEEFERIRPFEEWYLRKHPTPFTRDSIHLRFTDGRLTEIGRYRSYDPFPL